MNTRSDKLLLEDLSIGYADRSVVRGVNLAVAEHSIHAFIGPAGSGKTSILRTINGLAQELDRARITGRIRIDAEDVLGPAVDRVRLRQRVGMVFATPLALPGSIFDNVAFGLRRKKGRKSGLAEAVERALTAAQLFGEVKDRLSASAGALSGGQQQRLSLARTLALEPEIILLDEPCSGLDPISTARIEETMQSLRDRFTWVIVTNNTKQAARVSDRTAFFLLGELVEDGPTSQIFTAPRDPRTQDYVEGRFG